MAGPRPSPVRSTGTRQQELARSRPRPVVPLLVATEQAHALEGPLGLHGQRLRGEPKRLPMALLTYVGSTLVTLFGMRWACRPQAPGCSSIEVEPDGSTSPPGRRSVPSPPPAKKQAARREHAAEHDQQPAQRQQRESDTRSHVSPLEQNGPRVAVRFERVGSACTRLMAPCRNAASSCPRRPGTESATRVEMHDEFRQRPRTEFVPCGDFQRWDRVRCILGGGTSGASRFGRPVVGRLWLVSAAAANHLHERELATVGHRGVRIGSIVY